MIFLFILLVLGPLVVAGVRRAGFAGWLALLAAMIVLGGDPADPLGAAIAAAAVFVGCRFARSYIRHQDSDGASRRREQLAGRPVGIGAGYDGEEEVVYEEGWRSSSPPPPPGTASERRQRCRGPRR